jgi:pimeloyl-ACP methyl ester carboxylesterase
LQYKCTKEDAGSMNGQNSVRLHDGAVLAFQEYGDPSGMPVIFCHGWPSSRTMAQLADEPARSLGVRIISPDRPGISDSSMQLDRKLSDWPSLVEQLVDTLEIG